MTQHICQHSFDDSGLGRPWCPKGVRLATAVLGGGRWLYSTSGFNLEKTQSPAPLCDGSE